MKKVFFLLYAFLFSNALFSQDNLIEQELFKNFCSKSESDFLVILDSAYLDARQTLVEQKIEDMGFLSLFNKVLKLVYDIEIQNQGLVDQNTKNIFIASFASLVCNLTYEVDLEKIKPNLSKSIVFLDQINKIANENEKQVFVQEILSGGDKKLIGDLLGEFFEVLSFWVTKKLDTAIEKIILLMNSSLDQLKFADDDIFRDKIKKQQTAIVIFNALANACVQTGQMIPGTVQQGALGLFGTVFGLASQIIAINSDNSDSNQANSNEKISDEDLKKSWLVEKILSSKLTKRIIASILSCLQDYLHDKIDVALETLCDKLIEMLVGKQDTNNSLLDDDLDFSDIEDNFLGKKI